MSEQQLTFDEVTEEVKQEIDSKHYMSARNLLLTQNEADIAEILEEVGDALGIEKTVAMFRMLPKDVSVEVFSFLDSDEQTAIIQAINDKEITFILDELDFDDKIDVLEELPANIVDKILMKTPKEERKLINTFLNYPDDCAGTLMTPEYVSLQKDMTVNEALAQVRKEGIDSETIYTCYVKDFGRKLIGIVSLRSLVLADGNKHLSELMNTDVVSVEVYDDQEKVAEAFKKYGYLAIPVVDSEHRIVGIITFDDILDVIEDEATEDIERMAGVMSGDSAGDEYLDISVMQHVKNRLPWLLFLTVSAMITGTIIAQFENVLSQVIILVSYLPLLMGSGGNSGSQAATLVIRGLAVGDIDTKDYAKVMWKEARISIIVGVTLSLFNMAKVIFIDGQSIMIGLTVATSQILIVFFAKMLGGLLPIGAKKVGIDPALMASPMISSISDMFSVVTYLLLSCAFLGISI